MEPTFKHLIFLDQFILSMKEKDESLKRKNL